MRGTNKQIHCLPQFTRLVTDDVVFMIMTVVIDKDSTSGDVISVTLLVAGIEVYLILTGMDSARAESF